MEAFGNVASPTNQTFGIRDILQRDRTFGIRDVLRGGKTMKALRGLHFNEILIQSEMHPFNTKNC